jgi:alanine racemase
MIDITGLSVSVGDTVTVFGEKPTIIDLAKAIDTIPYEILTNVSERVKRVFFSE